MKEQVSALIDGALEDDEIPDVVDALASEPELAQAWSSFHLIGEALRAQPAPAVDVTQRVLAALDAPVAQTLDATLGAIDTPPPKPKKSISL